MVTDRRHLRPGQAFVELACGMLALALALAAAFAFSSYIIASLEMLRTNRREAGVSALTGLGAGYQSSVKSETVTVEPMAAEYIFKKTEVPVREEVHIPNMGGSTL